MPIPGACRPGRSLLSALPGLSLSAFIVLRKPYLDVWSHARQERVLPSPAFKIVSPRDSLPPAKPMLNKQTAGPNKGSSKGSSKGSAAPWCMSCHKKIVLRNGSPCSMLRNPESSAPAAAPADRRASSTSGRWGLRLGYGKRKERVRDAGGGKGEVQGAGGCVAAAF